MTNEELNMYNLFLIDEFVYGYVSCTQNNLLYKIIAILKNEIAFWGGIVLPLILIIIGIVSFIKAITSKKEIKQSIKKLLKKIGLAIFLSTIIIILNNFLSPVYCDTDAVGNVSIECCIEQAKSEITKEKVRMFDFLVVILIISLIFKKKNKKNS